MIATNAKGTTRWCAGLMTLAVVTLAAIGCAPSAGGGDAAQSARDLVELQSGLQPGQAPEWYTQRLSDLGYRIASLRYEQADVLAYEVDKASSRFSVRIGLDAETGAADNIEIQPADATTVASANSAAAQSPPAQPAPEPAPGARPAAQAKVQTPDPEPPARQPEATPSAAEPVTVPAPQPEPAPQTEAAPQLRTVTLPHGTLVATRLDDSLNSGTAQVGDQFSMTVNEPVVVAGIEVLAAGSRIWGYVAEVEAAARPNKGGRLVLKAGTIETRGHAVEFQGLVTAEGARLEGEDSVREDLKEIAVGAGIGGLVGGLLGGGKGVLAGVLIGGGGTFVATKGEQLRLPPDTQLYVELRQEVGIPID